MCQVLKVFFAEKEAVQVSPYFNLTNVSFREKVKRTEKNCEEPFSGSFMF